MDRESIFSSNLIINYLISDSVGFNQDGKQAIRRGTGRDSCKHAISYIS